MQRSSRRWSAAGVAAVCLAGAPVVLAHPGGAGPAHHSMVTGLLHPFLGADHLFAALALGLLAVRIGAGRALWALPGAFVGLMLLGGCAAGLGVPLPQAEWGIAASVIVLGLLVAVLPTMPLGAAAVLVGIFAIFHGHAHVAEQVGGTLLPYMTGLAIATLALQAAGIAAGVLALRANQAPLVRFAGAAIAARFLVVLIAG